uniref:Leucine-rich repeat-containing N-terminal plant-type domain-containing protein n=1 Tax=Salix viminalis TaxID=40686 RepID=A0A6N2MR23_SALVM
MDNAVVPQIVADLNSERQALLDFAAAVPHIRELNWNVSTSICSSWVGIACNKNGTGVVSVHLPGVGLFGPIPADTIGRLNSLKILSLRSNSLNGNLPSDILSLPSLRHLYLQQNNFSGGIPAFLSVQINVLDLSFNFFTGRIPPTVQNLTKLTALYLQNNSISEPYRYQPSKTQALNLSFNYFNVLKGKAESEKPKDFGSGVQEAEKNKLFFFEGCSFTFDLEDLLRLRLKLKELWNSLQGGSGGRESVVVKRLKEVAAGKKDFEQQMEL